MKMGYFPAGLECESDSESDSQLVMEGISQKREIPEFDIGFPQNLNSTHQIENADEDNYDLDIKELLDTGDVELLEEAVEAANIDINHKLVSSYGWSLSLYAAYKADVNILRWLTDKGGKISNTNSEKITGFMALSVINKDTVTSQQVLDTAKLLIDIGDDPEATQRQLKTPLMLASSEGNIDLVKFLIHQKVKVNTVDSEGLSALMYAAESGHGAVARLLLESGGDADLINHKGQTAADRAGLRGHFDLQDVIQKFSTMNKIDWKKRSALSERGRQMAVILAGLDLENYQELFEKHGIGVEEFLAMSEEDMIEIGICELGARNRLMEGQVQVHKRGWSKQSLPVLTLEDNIDKLRITCPDAAGILENTGSHVRFLKASVSLIRLQLRDHGDRFLKAGSDFVSPLFLKRSVDECRDRIQGLERECRLLSQELETKVEPGSSRSRIKSGILLAISVGVAFFIFKRKAIAHLPVTD